MKIQFQLFLCAMSIINFTMVSSFPLSEVKFPAPVPLQEGQTPKAINTNTATTTTRFTQKLDSPLASFNPIQDDAKPSIIITRTTSSKSSSTSTINSTPHPNSVDSRKEQLETVGAEESEILQASGESSRFRNSKEQQIQELVAPANTESIDYSRLAPPAFAPEIHQPNTGSYFDTGPLSILDEFHRHQFFTI